MVDDEDTIWNGLLAMVTERTTLSLKGLARNMAYTRDTDLVGDLGLTGDDAFIFMEKYAAQFHVKRGDYDPSNYFESEGLWLLPRWGRKRPKRRITLGMLEAAARTGEWISSELDKPVQPPH